MPAFVNWPGRLGPRKVTAPLHAADWMPTLTKLAGYAPAADLKWDGQDVWPVLTGEVTTPADRAIYIPMQGGAALRVGAWKLISRGKGPQAELFNLAADPFEQHDLAAAEPARVKELGAKLAALRRDDLTKKPADLTHSEPPVG